MNVRHALALDLVLFVVAHRPWQKADREITPSADRLAMVEAAVAGREGLAACDLEIERGGTSYTADTLADLRDRNPGCDLFLVVGQDQARNLDTWERVEEIRELATLVVVRRPGSEGHEPPEGWRFQMVDDVPLLEVSSSDVRARFGDGRPLDWLVPDAVVRLARERGLYPRSG